MIITGAENIEAYRLITLRAGLKLYVATGLKPNRAWTLTAMLRTATNATGNKYPRSKSGALVAIKDLTNHLGD